uniref:Cytochrome P450 n=1 Tax=Acrobeloides nanus TaxID=290746 RepID=A0A914CGT4_9BILA
MMETLVKDGDSYTDRDYYNEFLSILRGGKYGIVIQEGDEWKEQRKFIMSVFNKLGVGKNLLEQRILSEISAMISSIDKDIEAGLEHGKYDIKPRIEVCIASTINLLLLGYEFHGERSHEFHELNSLVIQYMTLVGQPDAQILMFRPYLYNWPYFNKIFAKFQKFIGGMQIEEIQKDANFNEYGEPTDYVTAFLREMKTRENEGYTMIELRNNLLEVWNAGQDTTTVTLLWSIIYMIHHQDIQQKVQEELDQVIGADRLITIEDKPYLPYTSAVTNEVQRCSNILPQNLARKTTRDVTIGGHQVKKGTAVMPMISVVLYDEKV